MDERKNNIFVVGVNMQGRTSEEIARESALKIVEITDKLMERKCIRKNKIKV